MADLASNRHAGEILHKLPGLPLLHAPDKVIGIIPGEPLAAVDEFNAEFPKLISKIGGFLEICPGETQADGVDDSGPDTPGPASGQGNPGL